MPKNPQEFAELFGAKIIGEVPDVGGGPFGMARLAHLMHQRLTPSQGQRPGRPTDSTWQDRPKVPMSEATQRRLAEIAEQMSTPRRRVSPMQVAAQLLEEAVRSVEVTTPVHLQENEGNPSDLAASEGGQGKPRAATPLQDAGHSLDATTGEDVKPGPQRKNRNKQRQARSSRRQKKT